MEMVSRKVTISCCSLPAYTQSPIPACQFYPTQSLSSALTICVFSPRSQAGESVYN
jgi:hypothetical protein